MIEFKEFPKVPRWYRDIVVTEKIDGTNGSIWIDRVPVAEIIDLKDTELVGQTLYAEDTDPATDFYIRVRAGSRSRFVTPSDDNFGFANWVYLNAEELASGLGEGVHYGEWWGSGIQRGYGIKGKRFSLFNTGRWSSDPEEGQELVPEVSGLLVVPVLYRGPLIPPNGVDPISEALRRLEYSGSQAAPGYLRPEGVIVFHQHARALFKATLEGDQHKGP